MSAPTQPFKENRHVIEPLDFWRRCAYPWYADRVSRGATLFSIRPYSS